MSFRKWIEGPRTRLDATAGVVDGILTSLTLAAGHLLRPGGGASIGLGVRVGVATALTTLFVFFVAHYSELRAELTRAEHQLSLLSHGKLVATRLGRRSLRSAAAGACVASLCGFAGAIVPLALCASLPPPPWIGMAATIALLGVLGAVLARSFYGPIYLWAILMMLGGLALAYLGTQLNITGAN
jgi:VIT1/CCC1 family predicted Fe2+/Mn2+ transporter